MSIKYWPLYILIQYFTKIYLSPYKYKHRLLIIPGEKGGQCLLAQHMLIRWHTCPAGLPWFISAELCFCFVTALNGIRVSFTSKDVMTAQWTDHPNAWISFAYLNIEMKHQNCNNSSKWRRAERYWGRWCRFFHITALWICHSQRVWGMSSITRIISCPSPSSE